MAAFQAPEKGTEEYDAWLDGPRPEAGNGRGQWLRARQLRGKAAEAAAAAAAAGGGAQGGVAQSQAGRGSGQPAVPVPTGDAATRSTLVAIRDDQNAHDSDRIRAAQALIALDRDAAQATGDGPSHLVALREVLDTLMPHERLAWLQGERMAHLTGEGQSG